MRVALPICRRSAPRKSHHATRLCFVYFFSQNSTGPLRELRRNLSPGSIGRSCYVCDVHGDEARARPRSSPSRQDPAAVVGISCAPSAAACTSRAHMCVPGRPPRNGTSAEPLPVNRPAWIHSLARSSWGHRTPRCCPRAPSTMQRLPCSAPPHPLLADCKRHAPLQDARRGGRQGTNLAPPGSISSHGEHPTSRTRPASRGRLDPADQIPLIRSR